VGRDRQVVGGGLLPADRPGDPLTPHSRVLCGRALAGADGVDGRGMFGGVEEVLDDIAEDDGGDVGPGEEQEVRGDSAEGFVHDETPFDRGVSVVVGRSAAGVDTAADRGTGDPPRAGGERCCQAAMRKRCRHSSQRSSVSMRRSWA
jgi:hypothetical protein